jgi:acetoin utilization deacetylase AcuC-like enzyme
MFPLFYSDHFLDHDTGPYHPENPGRLQAIVNALKTSPFAAQLEWRSPTPVTANDPRLFDALYAVHPSRYVKAVDALCQRGGGHIDPDTVVSPQTYDVALLAVNAWLDGVDTAINTHHPCFVLCRPPGHHASAQQGMGFCIFSNAAIAATYALKQQGINRVAILDWDVHHGNGTQAIVENNQQIAYCSLHQSPFYPGTGQATETGAFNNVLNCPMPAGSQLSDYQAAFEQSIVPFLTSFSPDLLIVSAGYDGVRQDPLASISLQPEDFSQLATYGLGITSSIVFGLEGGYDHTALGQAVVSTVAACLTHSDTHVG